MYVCSVNVLGYEHSANTVLYVCIVCSVNALDYHQSAIIVLYVCTVCMYVCMYVGASSSAPSPADVEVESEVEVFIFFATSEHGILMQGAEYCIRMYVCMYVCRCSNISILSVCI